MRLDAPDGKVLTTAPLTPTGGITAWSTQLVTLPAGSTGVHDLYLTFTRPNSWDTLEIASLVWLDVSLGLRTPLAAGWQVVRSTSTDVSALPGGGAEVTALWGDLYGGYNNARNILLRPAALGNTTAIVTLDFTPPAYSAGAGLILYWDDNNYTEVMRSEYGGRRLIVRNETNSGFGERWIPDPTNGPVMLKLERSGTTVTGSYSTDGKKWNAIGTVENGAFGSATELQAGFTAHNGTNGTPNAIARFTGFELDGKTLRIFE